jgi:hypothetical protein
VAAGGGGAQALLGQEGDTCLPGRVVSEHDAAVWRRLGQGLRRLKPAARPFEPGGAVRLGALDPLNVAGGQQALDRGLTGAPAH